MTAYTINFDSIFKFSDEQFYQLCRQNPDVKFESNAQGEIIIMAPTGGETGNRNAEFLIDFGIWNRQNNLGKLFDSSTGFRLPNGAHRSPDVAWVSLERWEQLTKEQKQKFPPLAPDFVLELLSPSDSLSITQNKMREYIENGVKLGWLINQKSKQVEIYRPGQKIEVLVNPESLSGEKVLPGLILNLTEKTLQAQAPSFSYRDSVGNKFPVKLL